VVLDAFKDSPAHIGGVEAGDNINHINGRLIKSMDL
jgi:C-terminal processing protease CtpA/Prc